jgi:hypothetical protein
VTSCLVDSDRLVRQQAVVGRTRIVAVCRTHASATHAWWMSGIAVGCAWPVRVPGPTDPWYQGMGRDISRRSLWGATTWACR